MKQTIQLLFLTTIIFFSGCNSEGKASKKSDEEIKQEMIIKEKIKSITILEHKKYANGIIETNGSLSDFTKYDTHGNVVEEISNGEEDSTSLTRSYKYDSKGNLLEQNNYNSRGELEHKWIYLYDKNNNKIEETVIDSEGKINWYQVNHYNYKGQLIQSDILSNFRKQSRTKQLFNYDSEGNLTKEILYPLNDNEHYTKFSYEYSSVGNLKVKNEYNELSNIYRTTSFDYNKDGNIIKKEESDEFGKNVGISTYDDKGKKIKFSIYQYDPSIQNGKTERWKYKHNEKGLIVEEDYYNSKDEMLFAYKYIYEFYK